MAEVMLRKSRSTGETKYIVKTHAGVYYSMSFVLGEKFTFSFSDITFKTLSDSLKSGGIFIVATPLEGLKGLNSVGLEGEMSTRAFSDKFLQSLFNSVSVVGDSNISPMDFDYIRRMSDYVHFLVVKIFDIDISNFGKEVVFCST